MQYPYITADVFTDRIFGGNPLAVFTDAQGLDDRQMQLVARELNLSETVFVLEPQLPESTCRLRIFTPSRELPFAGHPTIGSAFVLASIGAVTLSGTHTEVIFEENVGPVLVQIRSEGGQAVYAQLQVAKLPETGPPPPPVEALAKLLNLGAHELLHGKDGPRAMSCGVPFLLVPVRDLDAMQRMRPNLAEWDAILGDYWATEVFAFCHQAHSADCDLHGRMFAPKLGITEDPATGAAVAALGGYLAQQRGNGIARWNIEQGYEMGRPSTLTLEVEQRDGELVAVRVGGSAVLVSRGTFNVP